MEFIKLFILVMLGSAGGGILVWIKTRNNLRESALALVSLQQQLESERIKVSTASAIAEERKVVSNKQEESLINLRKDCLQLEKDQIFLKTKEESLETQISQLNKDTEEMRKRSLLEFDNLARKILDEKTKTFDENSQKALKGLIDPLKGDIKIFHDNIDKKYKENLNDRLELKQEIKSINTAGKEIKDSSDSLSKALRGDSKAQGKWGELILERILESSGLRKGSEFTVQGSYPGHEEGRLQPDITLHLSNKKNVFIDSKVSLTHYNAYINAEDDINKSISLKDLENSFCEHVKELGQKDYQHIQGITTLDFVLMFTPIESALALIIQSYEQDRKQSLFEYAWEKGVIITSPLTLMPILKTINLCWKAEYQNKNALNIAQEAGKLYDKFAGFVDKLQKVGDTIKKSYDHFEDAKRALSDGKGSLVNRTDKIRTLLKKERKVPDEYFDGTELINAGEEIEDLDPVMVNHETLL